MSDILCLSAARTGAAHAVDAKAQLVVLIIPGHAVPACKLLLKCELTRSARSRLLVLHTSSRVSKPLCVSMQASFVVAFGTIPEICN
jgi:hypothetical protein